MTPNPGPRRRGGGGREAGRLTRHDLIDQLTAEDDAVEQVLLKRPRDLTDAEIRRVAERRLALPAGDEKEALHAFERAFFEDIYGNEPAEADGTGRLVAAAPKRAPNTAPVAARTADGTDLNQAVNALAMRVADLADVHGSREAVRFLQRGLTMTNHAYTGASESGPKGSGRPAMVLSPDLADDGVPGPKTRMALRRMAARLGGPKVEEAIALGRFEHALRALGPGATEDGIKQAAGDAFGALFRDPEASALTDAPREESESLQMSLNDAGRSLLGERTFKALREDGVIGPKTAAAFKQVLAAAGPRRLAEAMGRNLGFFVFERPKTGERSLLSRTASTGQHPHGGKNFAGT